MGRERLVAFIQNIVPVSDTAAQGIAAHFDEKHIAKNDFLLKEGKVCNDYMFLEQGFMRAFTHDTEGNDVTTGFHIPDSIVFETASYFKRINSLESIQALIDCTGWYLDCQRLNELFHSIPEFREFGRGVLVNGFVTLKQRMLSMINETAEERYQALLTTNPEILQHAQLRHIASYLGITDSSLSRIRKEITHG